VSKVKPPELVDGTVSLVDIFKDLEKPKVADVAEKKEQIDDEEVSEEVSEERISIDSLGDEVHEADPLSDIVESEDDAGEDSAASDTQSIEPEEITKEAEVGAEPQEAQDWIVEPAKATQFGGNAGMTQSDPEAKYKGKGDFELYGFSVSYPNPFSKDMDIISFEVVRKFETVDDIKARFVDKSFDTDYLVFSKEELVEESIKTSRPIFGEPKDIYGSVRAGKPSICFGDREILSYLDGKWVR
jgi:hypothetical protein